MPILLGGVAFGSLYLTEKADGGEFSDEDEEIVVLLGAQAAVAIGNRRLYETSRHRVRQLESLDELSAPLLRELETAGCKGQRQPRRLIGV